MDKKKAIVNYYFNDGKQNKSATGRRFGVSPRTVGRYVEEYMEDVSDVIEEDLFEEEIVEQEEGVRPFSATHKSLVNDHLYKYHKEIDGVWYWWDHDDGEWCTDFDHNYSDEINEHIINGMVVELPSSTPKVKTPSNENFYLYRTPSMIQITKVDENGANVVVVQEGDKQWASTCEIIDAGVVDVETLKNAYVTASYVEKVKNFIKNYPDYRLEVDLASQCLVIDYKGYKHEFYGVMVDRMIEQLEHGVEPTNLCSFAVRLLNNPSRRAVDELYEFLIASDIEINEDGMVVCFKKVKANYTDCHTGKMDNSVGNVVEMPRFAVDDNSEVTCSHGLHVCSKAYLSHFGGERVLKVLVDPADFVSIPKDYYSVDGEGRVKAKARVCKYRVVEDITDEIY